MKITALFTTTIIATLARTINVKAQEGTRRVAGYTGGSNLRADNVTTGWNNTNKTNTSLITEQCYSNLIVTEGDITIHVAHNVDDETYSVKLTYIGIGWLGFGFSETGRMVPSQAVIGLPDSGMVSSYNMSSYSLTGVTKLDSPVVELTETTIEQNETHTILTFTKPLVDSSDITVSTTASNSYIWAVGSSNNLAYHSQRGSGSIMVYPCNQGGVISGNVTTGNDTTANTEINDFGNNKKFLAVTDDISVAIETNSVDQTATFEMTYAGIGWISIAFSTNGQMIGSPAIIGLLSAGKPQKYEMTSKSLAGVQLLGSTNAQESLTKTEFIQNNTHTFMKFTRSLIDLDFPEIFVDGTDNIFLYGIGSGNALGIHSKRGTFKVSLATCDPNTSTDCNTFTKEAGVKTRTLWLVHGLCMGIAWVILVPLGVGASLLRKLLPENMWFTIHRTLNMTGIIFTIIGFVLAVVASNKEGTPHFATNSHQKIGLSIFILALAQGFNGVVRPHLPSPATTDSTAAKQEQDVNEETDENIEDAVVANNLHNDNKVAVTKSDTRKYWEIGHRIVGVVLFGLALYNCYTGINKYATRFDDDFTVVFWSILGAISSCLILLGLYQCKKPVPALPSGSVHEF